MKPFCSHAGINLLHENKANAGMAAPFLPRWQGAASPLLICLLTYLRPVSAGLFLGTGATVWITTILLFALVFWLSGAVLGAMILVLLALAAVIDGAFDACFKDW